MREILFRGKRIDNNKWVLGDLAHFPDRTKIDTHKNGQPWRGYDVLPESVGEYTGLTDKNDKKIFEGDMFRMDEDDIAVVIFKDGCFRLEVHGLCGTWTESGFDECGGGYGIIDCEPIDWYYVKDMETIGNIHDNPELMKGENND